MVDRNDYPPVSGSGLVALSDLLSRAALAQRAGLTFGGERDLYDLFGYKNAESILPLDYLAQYRRGDIAKRIVDAYPDACWRDEPQISSDEDAQADTEFEKAWKSLVKRLKVTHYLNRADKLARLGRFAVLVLGVKGGEGMDQPMIKKSGPDDLIYVMPYGETSVTIESYVNTATDPRFGKPLIYSITPSTETGLGSIRVHYSRVIHIAEGLLDNDTFGTPALESIFNKLQDMLKIVGGGAEIYWRNARGGLHAGVKDDFELSEADREALSDEMTAFYNGLKRFIQTKGIDVTALNTQFADPSPLASLILDLVAGATGIPKRILIGSERGELASSQDESNWNNRVQERQATFCEPLILRALIERLQEFGMLPATDEIYIAWKPLNALSESEQAAIAQSRASALAAYTQDPASIVMPEEFRELYLGMTPEPEGGFPVEEPLPELPPVLIPVPGAPPVPPEIPPDPAAE